MSYHPAGAQKPIQFQATQNQNPLTASTSSQFPSGLVDIAAGFNKKQKPQPVTAPLAIDNTNKFAGSGILMDVDPKYYTEGSKSAAAKLLLG